MTITITDDDLDRVRQNLRRIVAIGDLLTSVNRADALLDDTLECTGASLVDMAERAIAICEGEDPDDKPDGAGLGEEPETDDMGRPLTVRQRAVSMRDIANRAAELADELEAKAVAVERAKVTEEGGSLLQPQAQ